MSKVTMTVKLCRALLGWSLLLPLLHACAPQVVPSQTTLPAEETPPPQDYVLGSEDHVEVQVWKNPDLSRTVTVRPDGKISLPLVGDVQAAGLTATQLAEAVTESLKTYYKEPAQVTVMVHQINSYAIYFLGEVRGGGRHLVRSGTTLLQAISIAGGFTPFASTNKIVLLRKGNDGREISMPIRYKDVLNGTQPNMLLRPGDTIIVR